MTLLHLSTSTANKNNGNPYDCKIDIAGRYENVISAELVSLEMNYNQDFDFKEYPTSALSSNDPQTIGTTTYTVTSSTDANPPGWKAFDKIVGSGDDHYWQSTGAGSGSYNPSTGNPIRMGVGLGGYVGEWLKIEINPSITLVKYRIQNRDDVVQCASSWVILGSDDDFTWTLVDERTNIQWASTDVDRGYQEFTLATPVTYQYYAYVGTSSNNGNQDSDVADSYSTISIGEWQLYEKVPQQPLFDEISPNSVSSAIGAFSLRAVNGATAKAVQVVQYQYPIYPFTSPSSVGNQFTQQLADGTYVVNCSSFYENNEPWKFFDINYTTFWSPLTNDYYYQNYNGPYFTIIDGVKLYGEWVSINLPRKTALTSYTIYNNSSTYNMESFVIAGSNDGINWTLVDTQTNITSWVDRRTKIISTIDNEALTVKAFCIDNNNNIYYYSDYNTTVYKQVPYGDKHSYSLSISAIACDLNNNLYFDQPGGGIFKSDTNFSNITRLVQDGEFYFNSISLCTGPTSNLYIIDNYNNRICVYTTYLQTIIEGEDIGGDDILVDSNNNIYILQEYIIKKFLFPLYNTFEIIPIDRFNYFCIDSNDTIYFTKTTGVFVVNNGVTTEISDSYSWIIKTNLNNFVVFFDYIDKTFKTLVESSLPPSLTFTPNSTQEPYSYFRLCIIRTTTSIYPFYNKFLINRWVLNSDSSQDFWADIHGNLTIQGTNQTLDSWLGGVPGYVATWYDQSGAGNHATQTIPENQPQIQKSTKGSGYMLLFTGSQYLVGFTYDKLNNTNYTICASERVGQLVNESSIVSCGNLPLDFNQQLTIGYQIITYFSDQYGNFEEVIISTILDQPIRYGFTLCSSTSGRNMYVYGDPLGNPLTVQNTGRTVQLSIYDGNFLIGTTQSAILAYFYVGEMYEILVFNNSLYDINGTTGTDVPKDIQTIYKSQSGYITNNLFNLTIPRKYISVYIENIGESAPSVSSHITYKIPVSDTSIFWSKNNENEEIIKYQGTSQLKYLNIKVFDSYGNLLPIGPDWSFTIKLHKLNVVS